jgi:hypothetical protein
MTHARAGAALIGSVGLTLAAADVGYAAHHWHAGGERFHLGVFGGIGLFLLLLVASRLLRSADPTGADRQAARARARRQQQVFIPLTLVGYGVSFTFGVTAAIGVILGEVGPIACQFALSGLREAANPRHPGKPAA